MTYVLRDGFTMNEIKTKDFGEIKAYMEDRAKTWELVKYRRNRIKCYDQTMP